MAAPNQGFAARIDIKLTHEQRAAWDRAAALDGITISDWIRRELDRASGMADERVRRAATRTIPVSYQHADKSVTTAGPRGGVRRRAETK